MNSFLFKKNWLRILDEISKITSINTENKFEYVYLK